MSLRIHVDAYSGYKANDRPQKFEVDEDDFEIAAVEDRWFDQNAEYFRVRTTDGKRFILRYNEREDEWTLQSGFDGDQVLTRPNTQVVTVGPEAIAKAISQIAGCQNCRGDEAQLFFDHIIADVLGMRGAVEVVMSSTAQCPNCGAELSEQSLIEPVGGVQIEAFE
jgi:hypothetical protein